MIFAKKDENGGRFMPKHRKLFCEYNPLFYQLAIIKESVRKDTKDRLSGQRFASRQSPDNLPYIWKGHTSVVLRKLEGVDMALQEGKAKNLALAGAKIDGIVIQPGETFSFWRLVGDPTSRKKGYQPGLVIKGSQLHAGTGGGLCQLANLVHYLVLHSPLQVAELHHHSDALFPDAGRRVPFGTGTSICYKAVDYRFKNTTSGPVQLRVWQADGMLYGELRGAVPLEQSYRLTEERHAYKREDGVFYRNSQIYRIVMDKTTREEQKELLLKNHSRVMYDYAFIPPNEIEADA